MKTHLFYTFLVIFASTSGVTLLGVTNVIAIKDGYLTALIGAFLIELAGAVIAIFKSANFFASEKTTVSAEEDIRNSIRKLDAAFGYANDRMKEQAIHFNSRFLGLPHLGPTPRTDIMVLVSQIKGDVGKIDPEVITHALGTIVDVLETKVHIGSHEKAELLSLCKSLPTKFAGISSRLIHALEDKHA